MKTSRTILLGAAVALMSFIPMSSSMTWKATEVSLGDIPQAKPVTIEFNFTNTGTEPILITNVQAGCGCTSVNYSKTPVLPGTSSAVTAVFNAAAEGAFRKTVTVTSNAEVEPRVLKFSGVVVAHG